MVKLGLIRNYGLVLFAGNVVIASDEGAKQSFNREAGNGKWEMGNEKWERGIRISHPSLDSHLPSPTSSD